MAARGARAAREAKGDLEVAAPAGMDPAVAAAVVLAAAVLAVAAVAVAAAVAVEAEVVAEVVVSAEADSAISATSSPISPTALSSGPGETAP